jgi:hypothetical protein
VVADSCNPIELTRAEWEAVAGKSGADCVNIEVVCSDRDEHRRRVEGRASTVKGLELPTWHEVVDREYAPWTSSRIVIDTALRTENECFDELASLLADRHH